MVKKLDENDYLIYERYRGLKLTGTGINIAQNIREKHRSFAEFLMMIGVEDDVAHLDAEGIVTSFASTNDKKFRETSRSQKNQTKLH